MTHMTPGEWGQFVVGWVIIAGLISGVYCRYRKEER